MSQTNSSHTFADHAASPLSSLSMDFYLDTLLATIGQMPATLCRLHLACVVSPEAAHDALTLFEHPPFPPSVPIRDGVCWLQSDDLAAMLWQNWQTLADAGGRLDAASLATRYTLRRPLSTVDRPSSSPRQQLR